MTRLLPERLRRVDWRRHAVPVSVWLAGWCVFGLILWNRSAGVEVVGISRGRVAHVSAPMAARIKAVLVKPADQVKKGQIVALLDDSAVAKQIEAIRAESDRVRVEHDETRTILEAEVLARENEWAADGRGFTADLTQLTLAIAELRTTLESERHLVESLRAERDTTREILEAGLASGLEYERVSAAYEAAAARLAATERSLADAALERDQAVARRDAYAKRKPRAPSPAVASEHASRAVRAQEALAGELEALREEHVLRAPCDGVVVDIVGRAGEATVRRPGESVLREPGEVIAAGEPVLAIAEAQPTEIVAYVSEHRKLDLAAGAEITLAAVNRPSLRFRTRVRAVTPTIERMPERLWAAPNAPAWGRPVILDLPDDLDLLPGEVVRGFLR
jgi:multidrug efflux pump subunit AcrA (membrane-fusion protein)